MAINKVKSSKLKVKSWGNVLVTGGTGFVGSHLVEELVKQHARVIIPVRSFDPYSYFATQKLNQKAVLVNVDIKNFTQVMDIVTKYDIRTIFHLAAQAIVETAYHNPRETYATNVMGTVNVLESARLYSKVKAIVVASSDKAYGKKGQRYVESDPLRGDHPYESSKSAADLIAQTYFKTYQLPVVITRFGNIYGEGDLNFSRIIPGIMQSIITNKPLSIRSNGKFVRDYLYVKDVARGYLLLAGSIAKIKGEMFNFGSDDTLSVLDLIKLTSRTLRRPIPYRIMNIAINEIPYQSLDYTKIRQALGWQPRYSLTGTLKQIFSWYQTAL